MKKAGRARGTWPAAGTSISLYGHFISDQELCSFLMSRTRAHVNHVIQATVGNETSPYYFQEFGIRTLDT